MDKHVYFFGEGIYECTDPHIVGGKGASLQTAAKLGLPIPPGFTISTEVCDYFSKHNQPPLYLPSEVADNMRRLEEKTGKKFGGSNNPLLVSVRSGAEISMPGMMDTLLNVGMNESTMSGLARRSISLRFAWDTYRRFIADYSHFIEQIPRGEFEISCQKVRRDNKKTHSTADLTLRALNELVVDHLRIFKKYTKQETPEEFTPAQLWQVISAVLRSWNNERAKKFREFTKINNILGTAVTIQAMVFGNMGNGASGVCFTRNPNTGADGLYGEYLINSQGEDVVSGTYTPLPIQKMLEGYQTQYQQLLIIKGQLEDLTGQAQEIEFTIEDSKLYILQFRALRVPVPPKHIFDHPPKSITSGIPAGPGVATGKIVLTSSLAQVTSPPVILMRHETSTDDLCGMRSSSGIITSSGGMTCHAAVVSRGLGIPCVVGCSAVTIDYEKHEVTIGRLTIREGEWISLDGNTGEIFPGRLTIMENKNVEAHNRPEGAGSGSQEGIPRTTGGDVPRLPPPNQDHALPKAEADASGRPEDVV